ncbi:MULTISPECIES: sensor histidine kinase [Kitasatospora]|uniref:histidine kinase n=1 Tax=Kitasatospora setae (strain ATCC 33774 / DSM 43861 / JCM 3304 / KCC A-0304 / NBRC 14216 / KM-6054) TaxID=452652 RepID=E4N6F8_KITSK|nr:MULTISPECIES: sensor histidine kinase [Kitasatospora]BAJ26789.1 putative two-component system sensor kinase [Kitasatospora setae KM-6054]
MRTWIGRAFPGPWRWRLAVREVLGGLSVCGLAALLQAADNGGWPSALVVGSSAVLFALRRGLPGPVLVLAAAGMGGPLGFLPLLVTAGYSAGRRLNRPWRAPAVLALGFLGLLGSGVLHNRRQDHLPLPVLLGLCVAGYLLVGVLPAVIGRYRAQRVALLDSLRERNEQLLRERVMIARQARLRERHRIAQDMHDSLGHQLALIAVHTGALEVDRTLGERQREAVAVLRQAATGAMRELREVVGLLREDTATAPGGVDAIDRLAETSGAAGALVELRHRGTPRPLAAATGHAAYRIAQEGLTNAHKHAPGAAITLTVRYEPDALVVEVANGPGTDGSAAVSGGQGLTGLRERARLLGGMVHSGPLPDGGFRLAGVLPYTSEGARAAVPEDEELALLAGGGAAEPDKRRRSPAVGCAIGALGVLGAVAAVAVVGALMFVSSLRDATVPMRLYDSIEVGQSEQSVNERLPVGSDFLTGDFRKLGPPVPAGAHCRWFASDSKTDSDSDQDILRFCFEDGLLVEKQHFHGKV